MSTYQIAIPHTGKISAGLAGWLTETGNTPLLEKSYHVCKSRNKLAHRFLRETDAEWLVYLDDDTWPATEGAIDFAVSQDAECVIVPYVFTNWRWSFCLEGDDEVLPVKKYQPGGEYYLRQISMFGGGGICLHRDLVERLPYPMWQEAPGDLPPEDLLFSYTLTQKLSVSAYVVWGSAMHHDKAGFDLLGLAQIQAATTQADLDAIDPTTGRVRASHGVAT